MDAEIRCACGNVIKTRSTKPSVMVGICNVCHPFYTGTQKFVDTAGRVDKFQQRMVKTQAAQAAAATQEEKEVARFFIPPAVAFLAFTGGLLFSRTRMNLRPTLKNSRAATARWKRRLSDPRFWTIRSGRRSFRANIPG